MRISVVTVCFNSVKTIGYTIESFLRQRHDDKELVVIDGESRDDTLSVVHSFGIEDAIVISEPDSGVFDAMNKGLAAFSGEAAGFLNSDDRFANDGVLSEISAALDEIDIVYGDIDFVSDHDTNRVVRRWRGAPYYKGAFADGWMPPHPTFYARRDVIDAVGYFDLRYRIAADYDYMLRALELHDYRAGYISRVWVDMMVGGNSTSGVGAYLKGNLESLDARRKWLNSGMIDKALIAKPLRKLPQFLARRPR
ncbi:MAG: glycosyltransferase [Hyphomicrobiales bacterium]|nr:glycosyltransferase [Hyphomicrobiales bacterium]